MGGGTLRVASEVKALLAGGSIDTEPDPAGHVGFFVWGSVPEPHTLYRGIRSLPAGSTMRIGQSGPEEPRRYADIAQAFRENADGHSIDEAADELRDALLDTVRHHLVADVDVGVFLSAGLDSTTQAALVAELGGRLRTVTLGFAEYRGTAQDEVPLAELVARQYGAEHQTIWITRADFQSTLDTLVDRMDQPTIDGVNVFFVARAAAAAGLKVALSGLGGDELFGGYPSFVQVPRLVSVAGNIPAARMLGPAARRVLAPAFGLAGKPKYAGALEYGINYGSAYLLRRCVYAPWELDRVLDPDILRDGWKTLSASGMADDVAGPLTDSHAKISALESSLYMRNQLLRDADWASMSHSLEVRVPFVDWTLWNRVAPLRRHGIVTKSSMASAAHPPLPDAVRNRAKSGFVVPTRQWLALENGEARREPGLRGWARHVYARAIA
jgi:asparagine synthase (glutamine-hydrolysing)